MLLAICPFLGGEGHWAVRQSTFCLLVMWKVVINCFPTQMCDWPLRNSSSYSFQVLKFLLLSNICEARTVGAVTIFSVAVSFDCLSVLTIGYGIAKAKYLKELATVTAFFQKGFF